MKIKNYTQFLWQQLGLLALTAGVATAGAETTTTMSTTSAPISAPSDDVVSGMLKLDFNTHFISYGADVWGDGSSMSDPGFNPNLELYFALPGDLTLTLGTWWDVNSKGDSPIGGRLQEVDVYAGLSYSIDKLTIGLTYQAWMYANAEGSNTEDILDLKFSYDTFLSPSLTIHQRLDQGAANGDEGTVIVLGLSHSIEAGPATISFPLNIAYFPTGGFHQNFVAADPGKPAIPASFGVAAEDAVDPTPQIDEADTGFGYASLGVAASLPLSPLIGDSFGDWSLNAGLTYFVTNSDIIPNNPSDSFLTASLGVALSF
ncbi:MAG: hypothetical protein EAZ42_07800 [Verrucomicrobia bacterium]|nr:MAG: hypothetical protein EAZ42_07800 [Verrucomicrobiota bacterium]